MDIHLTSREFRLLLDMVYIGNWVLNSTREDPFEEYDKLHGKIFSLCRGTALDALVDDYDGGKYPSRAYEEGGIHTAIEYYEDNIFFDLLAEALSRRDMGYPENPGYSDLWERIDRYMEEFERSGLDHLVLEN